MMSSASSYDADLIVIGAGPAGMAAAVRARWVKTSRVIPASVLLLDPGGLGGIAAMGTVFLTGPSWGGCGSDLIQNVINDVERLQIPLLKEAAIGLRRVDDCWQVQTASRTLTGQAVVVATGLRRLCNDRDVRTASRLTFLSGGYQRSIETFTTWSTEHIGARLLLIGGPRLDETLLQLRACDAGRNDIVPIYEPRQQVERYHLDGNALVVTVREDARLTHHQCEMVMLDYHSYELDPPSLAFLPPEFRDEAGYCAYGPSDSPQHPGFYAAGDCAGPPSMCLKALAEGSIAGFQAYQYIYERKFNARPHLFAFFPSPVRPPLSEPEIPILDPERHLPVGLRADSQYAGLLAPAEAATSGYQNLAQEVERKIATVHVRRPSGDIARDDGERVG